MNLSPSERYARAAERARFPETELFRSGQRFDLDEFQIAACHSLESGNSVLVAAPTGAGKTVVAEFAVFLTMRDPHAKIFYTTPIKALSNQKYQELVAQYGPTEVGLLTGDTSINPQARVVIMTTEVLRNMIYVGSALLTDLAYVVMDEVHYLADRFRGAVWEEVIIHLPSEVRLVSLSATVSNAEEFGDWLQTVRGDTDVIVSEHRPTPLYHHVLVGSRLHDLYAEGSGKKKRRVNPDLLRAVGASRTPSARRGHRRFAAKLDRGPFVELLDEAQLLPAIFFVFSRNGCDDAVRQVYSWGIQLTTRTERDEIRWIIDDYSRTLLDEDLGVLGFYQWRDALERGVAAHHAGMLPIFKEVVEVLFQRKLLKVVFATETLALGINMPARTVVLERLEKFNGISRVPITPGEFTQLTGRAGRRGIDVEGHAIVQWREGMQPESVAALASKRTYPLNSSFRPTYNMTVNLISQFGRERTRRVLESSFAQFQADRAVVNLARRVRQQQDALVGYAESMRCERGDFMAYSAIRRELTDVERQKILPGDHGARDERSKRLAELRDQLRKHPCHRCPEREQHARWAERYWRLQRDTEHQLREIDRRTGAIARVFDRLTELLLRRGYLESSGGAAGEPAITATVHGELLRRIFGDRDLLVAECIRRQLWLNLNAHQLAAMCCVLTYEPRRDEVNPPEGHLPKGEFRTALARTESLWEELDEIEDELHVPRTIPLATSLAKPMFKWSNGAPLERVLEDAEMSAGDFVRWSKQTLDLLDQIGTVASGSLARTAQQAADHVRRGIVAYTGMEQ